MLGPSQMSPLWAQGQRAPLCWGPRHQLQRLQGCLQCQLPQRLLLPSSLQTQARELMRVKASLHPL